MLARAQIPNALTLGRALAVPVALLLVLFYPQWHILLFGLFLAASITDFFDGYLARKWQVTSPLGALLDPIADKLLVALLLIHLLQFGGLSLLPVAVMILREIYLSGLREFLASRQIALPVSKGGKIKTALQMAGVSLMLAAPAFGVELFTTLGSKLLWAAAAFSLASAIQYTRASLPHLRG